MEKHIVTTLRYFCVGTLFLSLCPNSAAQDHKNELSAYAGGLFSYIDQDLNSANIEKGNGGMVGLRYSYYLNNNWSIGTGVEYQSYNADVRISTLAGAYTTTDIENEAFEFRYSAEGYNEKQNLKYLNIPVTVQYETKGLTRFYVSAGAKAGFSLSGSYETSVGDLNTSGYYPQYDAELFDPEFMGFGALGNVEAGKQDLKTKMTYSGTFEAGIKQMTGSKSSVYIGFFIDYGLNSVYDKGENRQIIQYTREAPVNMKYNTVLDSGLAGDSRLVAYGFKIRVGIL